MDTGNRTKLLGLRQVHNFFSSSVSLFNVKELTSATQSSHQLLWQHPDPHQGWSPVTSNKWNLWTPKEHLLFKLNYKTHSIH